MSRQKKSRERSWGPSTLMPMAARTSIPDLTAPEDQIGSPETRCSVALMREEPELTYS
jgi:hypothetical protein